MRVDSHRRDTADRDPRLGQCEHKLTCRTLGAAGLSSFTTGLGCSAGLFGAAGAGSGVSGLGDDAAPLWTARDRTRV